MSDNQLQKFSIKVSELIEALKHNPTSFAKSLGYSRADTIFNILKKKGYPSVKILFDIHHAHPEVNIDHLITGRGNLFHNTRELDNYEQPEQEPSIAKAYQETYIKTDKLKDKYITTLEKQIKTYEELLKLKDNNSQ